MQVLLLSFRCGRFEVKENYPLPLFQENSHFFYISTRAGMRSEMNSPQCLHVSRTNALGGSCRPTLQFVRLEKPDDIKQQSAWAPAYRHPWHSHAGPSGGSRHLPCSFRPSLSSLVMFRLISPGTQGTHVLPPNFLLRLRFKNHSQVCVACKLLSPPVISVSKQEPKTSNGISQALTTFVCCLYIRTLT